MTLRSARILQEGSTCWRIARAGRAAVLVDGAAYYGALREAMLRARRSIFIVGWDIDSRVELVGADRDPKDGGPLRLRDFLVRLVRQRPELRVRLLLWDYSVVYALEREPLPLLSLHWTTPPQIKVCLDDVLPLGACHHQKVVVVDDSVAFCGGLDLTIRRWDTPRHDPADPDRCDPAGVPYRPFHDVQMCVDGDACLALAELVRTRWEEAACERPPPVQPIGDAWPATVRPDFLEMDVGIARTLPTYNGTRGVKEIERLCCASIDRAERRIYVENQFLTADVVAERLARRMAERATLEVLLVTPRTHHNWVEAQSMRAGRYRFMGRLVEAGVADRARLVFPEVSAQGRTSDVMVHSKVMIVDDALLRIGSSNLNNRSLGMDTECDLAVEAANPAQRDAIAAVGDRLLGEHLGVPAERIARSLRNSGSLLRTVDALSGGDRTLRPIQSDPEKVDHLIRNLGRIIDPDKPIEASTFMGMFDGEPDHRVIRRIARFTLFALVLVALVLAWRFTPLARLTDPDRLNLWFAGLADDPWAFLIVPAIYVIAGLIAFPVTALIAATSVVFGPWLGLALATIGSLLSATVVFHVGALLGRRALRTTMRRRLNRISRAMADKGVLSVTAVRIVPIAPFTLVNLVCGAIRISYRDYMIGTVLGMAPGILVMTMFGHRLARIVSDPDFSGALLVIGAVTIWLLASLALQIFLNRMRRRRSG